MTWLTELIESVKEVESPSSFYYWAALAAISAVVKDNIWIDRGGVYNLYPNIYVLLHADSGLKKGPPVSFAKQLVQGVNNTRVISGRSSIQGIMKDLGTAYTIPGKGVQDKSVAFICASEFSSSLVSDPIAMTILTDLYDRHYNIDKYKSLLKLETFELKSPTITMLGAINEAHFESFIEKKDMQGGFIARTFIVHESEENIINSLAMPLKNPPTPSKFIPYLKELAELKGAFKPFGTIEDGMTEVGLYYDTWYNSFRKSTKAAKIKDETGTLNRFGDSVVKTAMLISLSECPKLEISLTAMKEAICVCEKLIGNVRKTTMHRGKSNYVGHKNLIINELLGRDNHMISREQLLKKYWMHFSTSELDEIMLSFDQAGMIVTQSVGNRIVYEMPEKQVEELKKYFGGKN